MKKRDMMRSVRSGGRRKNKQEEVHTMFLTFHLFHLSGQVMVAVQELAEKVSHTKRKPSASTKNRK